MSDFLKIAFIILFILVYIGCMRLDRQSRKKEAAYKEYTKALEKKIDALKKYTAEVINHNNLLAEQNELLEKQRKQILDLMIKTTGATPEKDQNNDRTNTDGSGRSPEDRTAGDQ